MDTLEEEYLVYHAMSNADIRLARVWKELQVVGKLDDASTEQVTYHLTHILWRGLQDEFPNLSKVALAVLTVQHCIVGEERVFSMIRKNETDFCSNLDLRRSFSSIMTIKMNNTENSLPRHRFKPSNNLLTKCKAACRKYNRTHTSVVFFRL